MQFEWYEEAMARNSRVAEVGPTCPCGQATVARNVTKESANKGRKFWTCHKD
jgi:hypothetical protein